MNLCDWYEEVCQSHNMGAHAPRLKQLASECKHVTEFGTRNCLSSVAILMGNPARLVSYDIKKCDEVEDLQKITPNFHFIQQNVWHRKCAIDPTDMLFIDTEHLYRFLKRELDLHASKVKKFIAIHDTYNCPELNTAIEELLWDDEWDIKERYDDCCGMTILRRI